MVLCLANVSCQTERMANILNILGGISPNAISSTALKIKEYFKSHTCTTAIYDDYDEDIADVLEDFNIDYIFLGDSLSRATFNLSKLLTTNTYGWDIIHIYGAAIDQLPIPALYSEATKTDLIIRYNGYHQSESYWKQKIIDLAELYMIKRSDKLVFNAEAQMNDILSRHNVSHSNKVYIIPPGIPEDWFNPVDNPQLDELRNEYNISDKSFIIGSCLTPRPVKRIDRSLHIIKRLSERYDIEYIIVGDSEYVPHYKRLAKSMGISDSVNWVGKYHSRELSRIYSLFDVTIMTSEVEGFGQSITESYLCNTPCVAFDIGGMSDQIIHGDTGYLANQDNTSEFESYVEKYIENPDLKEQFGRRGREYVERNFTLSQAAKKYDLMLQNQ
jgi:glycosyltransferase involved in cell wall biosynthesis